MARDSPEKIKKTASKIRQLETVPHIKTNFIVTCCEIYFKFLRKRCSKIWIIKIQMPPHRRLPLMGAQIV